MESRDVQGLLLQGYGKLRAAGYLILRITDATLARDWIGALLPEITFGPDRPEAGAVNVAFTATGLVALGPASDTVSGFPPEFLEGMASAHRSRLLGDVGAAAPGQWAWGGPENPQVDGLLLVFARDDAELTESLARHRTLMADHGVVEVGALDTQDIGFREHFGFRDGLSQPTMAGVGKGGDPLHEVATGEFVLGHLNGHGQYPRSPLVPAHLDPDDLLPPRPDPSPGVSAPVPASLADGHDFGRNGSYLVVRTLDQDVGGFWRYVDQQAPRHDGVVDGSARTALAARMVGRWPSGAPLTRSPEVDRVDLATENGFGYDADDREGTRCPLGSHIRRTNPRDSLPPKPGTSASVEVANRHRLIRRGRSFGPRVEPEESMTEDAQSAPSRGLHFIALCADIARQFEFVSHTWAMNPQFAGLFDDADPLLGGHGDRGTSFTIQASPVRRRHTDVPAFVTPRGGAYFFMPGGRALRYLADDRRTSA
ncbi:peroxidase [Nocardioides sp. AN3]